MDEREWQAERERREQEELEKARARLTKEQSDRLDWYRAEMHERDIYATKHEISIANELRTARSQQDQASEIKHILARADREAMERANQKQFEEDRQREHQAQLDSVEREQQAQRDAALEQARRRAFDALSGPQVIADAATTDRQRKQVDHYELLRRQQPAEQEPARKSESEWRKTAREVLESKPEQSDQDRNISDRQQERENQAGQARGNAPKKGMTRGGRTP